MAADRPLPCPASCCCPEPITDPWDSGGEGAFTAGSAPSSELGLVEAEQGWGEPWQEGEGFWGSSWGSRC